MATESTALLQGYALRRDSSGQPLANGHTNGHANGKAHIVHICKEPQTAYESICDTHNFSCGLTLEELLPYLTDAWWQKLRRTLFCAYWLIFLLVLVTACTLAISQHGMPCGPLNLTQESSSWNTEVMLADGVVAP